MKRAIEPSVRSQKSALILIDVINALDFEGSESLVHAAEHAARAIESLAARARAQGLPVIYVNDNFGQWRSDFMKTIEVCSTDDKPGHNVSRRLRPHADDYFVLKPMHSSFFCTPFELVLRKLEVTRLILCGFATDLCLLFTAHDAHMRGFALTVPHDCSAANSEELHRRALVS
jgi:nicotinamidase-related amidase